MGRYIYYKSTPDNLVWMANWSAMSLSSLNDIANNGGRLTLVNKFVDGSYKNVLEWVKDDIMIENIATNNENIYPFFRIRNNYLGSYKTNCAIDIWMCQQTVKYKKQCRSYMNASVKEMEVTNEINITDTGGIDLNKVYEKYLLTYDRATQDYTSDIYHNYASTVNFSGNSEIHFKPPIFYYNPYNSDGYFKLKQTQNKVYFETGNIDQYTNEWHDTSYTMKNETTGADNTIFIKQASLISDCNYIFKQAQASDKGTVELKVNMNKTSVTTKSPIKYEIERNSSQAVILDKLTLSGNIYYEKSACWAYSKCNYGGYNVPDNTIQYMTITPATIDYSTHWISMFGTYYGFKYNYDRKCRVKIDCVVNSWCSSTTGAMQYIIGKRDTSGTSISTFDTYCRQDPQNSKCECMTITRILEIQKDESIEFKFYSDAGAITMTFESLVLSITPIEYTS